MYTSESNTSIEEIARWLRERRQQGQPPTLFLGAHTSEFLRNAVLRQILPLLMPGVQVESDIHEFELFYKALVTHCSLHARHNILSQAAQLQTYREEDNLLVELVQAGFFSDIITTQIGTLLENAFHGPLKEFQHYEVLYPGDLHSMELRSQPGYCHIFKVFGDLASRLYYPVIQTFDLEKDLPLQAFLQKALQNDVLCIGYNAVWDQGIERAISSTGKEFWYVNEEGLPPQSLLASLLQDRTAKHFFGPDGDYLSFLPALHKILLGDNSSPFFRRDSSLVPREISELEKSALKGNVPVILEVPPLEKKAFISYAHADSRHLDRFSVHLKGCLPDKTERLKIWSDRDIKVGDAWEPELKQALESASIAVLLVSADFLASNYVRNYELPTLLKAAEVGRVKLISFVLGPCAIKTSGLEKHQIFNDMSGSFSTLSRGKREDWWNKLAQYIVSLLRSAHES
jgi:hypothetical protein